MKDQMINAPRVTVSPKTFASLLEDSCEVYTYTRDSLPLPESAQDSRSLFYKGVLFTEAKEGKEIK